MTMVGRKVNTLWPRLDLYKASASAKRLNILVQHGVCYTKRSLAKRRKQCLTKHRTMKNHLDAKLGEAAKQ